MLNLWLVNGALAPTPPAGTTAASGTAVHGSPAGVSLTAATASPAAFSYPWGNYKLASDVTFTGGIIVTLYLTADTDALINDVWAGLIHNADSSAMSSGARGLYTDSSGTSVASNTMVLAAGKSLKFEIALSAMSTPKWKAGDTLRLDIAVAAVTAEGTPTDVKVLYGSPSKASRVALGVNALPSDATGGGQQRAYFLADNGFGTLFPSSATASKRATESTGTVNNVGTTGAASIAVSSEWTWGKTVLASPLKATGDAYVTVFIGMGDAANAGVLRGLRAILIFTPPTGAAITRQQDIGLKPQVYQSASALAAPNKYTLGVNMTGVDVPAGTSFELHFLTWSTSDNAAVKFYFFYNGLNQPAGVQFIVGPGGSAGGPSSSSSATTTATTSTAATSTTKPASSPTSSAPSSLSTGAAEGAGLAAGAAALAKAKNIDPPADVPGVGAIALLVGVVATVVLLRRRA